MSLRYGKSYPPKRIEDNRSRFEQKKIMIGIPFGL